MSTVHGATPAQIAHYEAMALQRGGNIGGQPVTQEVAPEPRKVTSVVVRLKPTEKEFMAQVIAYAKLKGYLVYHTHDSRKCVAGFPDLLLLRADQCFVFELKIPPNKPTAAQTQWIEAFQNAGIVAEVLTPDGWDEFKKSLE